MYVYVFKIFKEMGIVTHIFNLSTQKQKQAGLWGQSGLHTQFQNSQSYIVKYWL